MRGKNDEFYTQYSDIEKEINAYREYNPDVFRDKTILLPCDDPEWSNFTKFFAQNFETFGLKKLISTSYAEDSKVYGVNTQPSLLEIGDPKYDKKKTKIKGKIYTLTDDQNGDGKTDVNDLKWQYLEGDGDFRSSEIKALRDEADIIITNPPFSLFRPFLAWIVEADKQFSIIGNMNGITYKEVFPLIKANKTWLGPTISSGDREFRVPDSYPITATGWRLDDNGTKYLRIKGVRWFTNIDHGRRHQPLQLMTMADNLRFNKKLNGMKSYDVFDNYDAIEVPFTDAIPSDYAGLMGVPISFLDKYSPEQFDILGTGDNGLIDDEYKKTPGLTKEFVADYYKAGGKGAYNEGNPTPGIYKNGIASMAYKRIFIKHKK